MATTAPRAVHGTWRDRLLGLPLFYKVLVANTAIVVVGAVAGTTLTLRIAGESGRLLFDLVFLFTVIGTVTSVVVNWVVLRAALRPLVTLERTVNQVRQGNFDARARKVGFSDPSIDALIDTFNGMLDTVERYRGQLHDISVHVLNAQEEERKRISRELHDDTAQALTAQLLRLKTIEATGGTLKPDVLSQLIEMTAQTLESVRHMAHELRPPSLDDLGLVASLEGLAAQYRERFDIHVHLEIERAKGRLTPDIELAVYRIVQEALTNVAKHAQTNRATVTLRYMPNRLLVRITDDGQGFELEQVRRHGEEGLGLFGMRERAMLVGGTVTIRSRRGGGTEVDVAIPLPDAVTAGPTEVYA